MPPNKGKGETVTLNGKVVGFQKIGQKFDKSNYFWGRPSAVCYNAVRSVRSNKASKTPNYLILIQKRIHTFLMVHPYLKKEEILSDMVTASGIGLDPNISPQGALIQMKRVVAARNLPEEKVKVLVENKINTPAIIGTSTVNVLELNVALDELK